MRHRVDELEQRPADGVVRLLFAAEYVLHVSDDLVEQRQELGGRLAHLDDVEHGRHGFRTIRIGDGDRLLAQLQTDDLFIFGAILLAKLKYILSEKCISSMKKMLKTPSSTQRKALKAIYRIKWLSYLWLVRSHLTPDGREHAAGLAAGNAQIDADVRLEAHSAAQQRCVDGDVHRVVAFTRIVLVDQRTVVGYLVSGCPPAWRRKFNIMYSA